MSEPHQKSLSKPLPESQPSSSHVSQDMAGIPSSERIRAARALRRESTDSSSDSYFEMQPFYTHTPGQPLSDPMQHGYMHLTVKEPYYTKSITEEIELLKEYGFIIDYPKGRLGKGLYGEVFKGVYGPQAKELKDKGGQPLRNVDVGLPFAAKLVDFTSVKNDPAARALSVNPEQITRDAYEMEKYIMTWANHPNITPIRIALNMGEPRDYDNLRTSITYLQYQRIYLIMDFAELGSIEAYLDKYGKTMASTERLKLSLDCFWGLKYLHDHGVAHGDVKMDNVLIFNELNGVVAKWCDFGLGYVSRKGEFTPIPLLDDNTLINRKRDDCSKLYLILRSLWEDRNKEEEDETTNQVCDRFIEMRSELRTLRNLDQMLIDYGDVLNWSGESPVI